MITEVSKEYSVKTWVTNLIHSKLHYLKESFKSQYDDKEMIIVVVVVVIV